MGASGITKRWRGEAGAGPGFHVASAVHTHMTNTRITDPKVLETRYPVRLERLEIRRGSGGRWQWAGCDGLIRQYRFLKPVEISLLTQRRTSSPYGLEGGDPAVNGENIRIHPDGRSEALPGAICYVARAGESLIKKFPLPPGYRGWLFSEHQRIGLPSSRMEAAFLRGSAAAWPPGR